MSRINLGHFEGHEKLTARLFYQPIGENGYQDAGNVMDYKYAPDNQYRTRMNSDKGFRFVDDEQIDSTHQKWEATLDEQDEMNTKLLFLATRTEPDVLQDAGVSETASFESVIQGRSYFLDVRPVTGVIVTVSAVAKTEGVDYTVDGSTGSITILSGASSTIMTGDDVDVEFDNPARNFENYVARNDVLFRGPIKIFEYNQASDEPLREISFDGVVRVSAWPEQTGEFGKYAVTITATTRPAIKKAHEATAGSART